MSSARGTDLTPKAMFALRIARDELERCIEGSRAWPFLSAPHKIVHESAQRAFAALDEALRKVEG